MLEIKDLHVQVEGKKILNSIALTIKPGEVHVLMGPNGSGKSTLGHVLAGHPRYTVEEGDILWNGKSILKEPPEVRAKCGLFLAFQYPVEIPGLKLRSFLFTLAQQRADKPTAIQFQKELHAALQSLGLDAAVLERDLNVGFSGGEKKRIEVLQLLIAMPRLAILDETDSGLDIDSLKIVADAIQKLRNPAFSVLLITHYPRILTYVQPDVVHVLIGGQLVATGDHQLAHILEKEGYAHFGVADIAEEQAQEQHTAEAEQLVTLG